VRTFAALGIAGLVAAGCPAPPEAPAPPTGGLIVEGTPPDANLTVNEQLLGPIRMFNPTPMPLQPGTWRVEVSAPGWFPWYGEVEVGTEVVTIRVDLRPVPP